MSKLSKEELLTRLEEWRNTTKSELCNLWVKRDEQAYQQIKEMIQKSEVTEEWIEEWEKKFPVCVRADIIWNKRYIKQMLEEAGVHIL